MSQEASRGLGTPRLPVRGKRGLMDGGITHPNRLPEVFGGIL